MGYDVHGCTRYLYKKLDDGNNNLNLSFILIITLSFQYVEKEYSNADRKEIIRFSFKDPVNGYIELHLTEQQEKSHRGWDIIPRKSKVSLVKYFGGSLL